VSVFRTLLAFLDWPSKKSQDHSFVVTERKRIFIGNRQHIV